MKASDLAASANAGWDGSDASASLEALRGDVSVELSQGVPVEPRIQADGMRMALKRTLEKRRIFETWRGMNPESRSALILTVSPFTPRWPGDEDAGGERGASRGAVRLLPKEMNLRDLSGTSMVLEELFTAWSRTERFALLDKLCLDELESRGALPDSKDLSRGIIFLADEYRGQRFEVTVTATESHRKKFQLFVTRGAAITVGQADVLAMRQTTVLEILILICDEIRTVVFGRDQNPFKTLNQARGCGHCGAIPKTLPACGACKMIAYCNGACQKAGWPKHKAFCKAHRSTGGV